MTVSIITTKGQVVIPSIIRRHLNIRKGTKFCIIEKEGQIILQPLTADYFENMAGILKTKGKLSKAILEERQKDKELEDKKWSKS